MFVSETETRGTPRVEDQGGSGVRSILEEWKRDYVELLVLLILPLVNGVVKVSCLPGPVGEVGWSERRHVPESSGVSRSPATPRLDGTLDRSVSKELISDNCGRHSTVPVTLSGSRTSTRLSRVFGLTTSNGVHPPTNFKCH